MNTIGYINISLEIWGGILSLVIVLCIRIGKRKRSRTDVLFIYLLSCNAVILFSDGAAWLFKGRMDTVSYYGVRISNFLVFAMGYVLLMLFASYLTSYLELSAEVSRIPLYIVRVMCASAFIFVVISQFNHMFYIIDENNIYHRQSLFWLSQAGGIAGMAVNTGLMICNRKLLNKTELLAFSSYIILPVTAMAVQIFIYGVALLNLATTAALLILYLTVQVEQARKFQEKELELADTRVAIMLSQIQPHFLFNSLAAIKQLCDIDPKQAKEAIVEFSGYLRGNLDALTNKNLITFEQELGQVRNYLSLEKKRFGNCLNIRYDIRAGGFMVPPLTVQTIVENAVRHGVTKKEGGGTVSVSVCEDPEFYVVTVSDDGVGMHMPVQDGRSHIGIENARVRVESMCGGHFLIDSTPGVGTSVIIKIPKGDGAGAYNSSR